jgi:hypothetical protein
MILSDLDISTTEFSAVTGWTIRPEGACHGSLCVPLGDAVSDGRVDVRAAAQRLGMPLVHDDDHDLWALGPWTGSGHALPSAEAPELTLPDLDGNEFSLSTLRGQKVLLLAWAPY